MAISKVSLISLTTILFGVSSLAVPAANIQRVEERTQTGTFLGALIGLLKSEGWTFGSNNNFQPCANWGHDGNENLFVASGYSFDGTVMATACFSNYTDVDNGMTYQITPFSDVDAQVAACITDLHNLQADTCISVYGSHCDTDNYVSNGGIIKNGRMPIIGSGTSSYAQLTNPQSEAAQDVILNALAGQNIALTGNNPEIYFWDKASGNGLSPAYSLDLNGPYSPSC